MSSQGQSSAATNSVWAWCRSVFRQMLAGVGLVLIIIAIPVFMNGALYRMPVRFRYRKSGGQVKFILTPYNPEKAFKAAFDEAIATARADTALPLFLGTPEATA